MTITDYGDSSTSFNAFLNGQVDILDTGVPSTPPIASFCSGDIYCTGAQTAYYIYDQEINHRASFLGTALQTSRLTSPPSLVLPTTPTTGNCGTGFGQLTIKLENQEIGNTVILDALNKLTISSQPLGTNSVTVQDSGGSQPTGIYVFPCVVAGTYEIASSVYNATAPCSSIMPSSCVSLGSGQSVSTTLLANWNSPSTRQPSLAGIYVPQAIAHLLDKPAFIGNSPLGTGTAVNDDEWSSPAQNLPDNFPLTAECADHPWFNPCSPVSAYNLVADNVVAGSEWWTQPGASAGASAGYSGVSDLRAACDDFVKAGFTVTGGANSTDCVDVALASLGSSAPSSYPHLSNNGQQIIFFIRTQATRKAFGQIIADSVNFLFGTPNNGQTYPAQAPQCTVLYPTGLNGYSCTPGYVGVTRAVCIFQGTCTWNLYTGAFELDTTPSLLYELFHSGVTSGYCGGIASTSLSNYAFYCDPRYDTDASAAESSSTISQAYNFFARAAVTGDLNGMTLPVYTPVSVYAALNGWNMQQGTTSTQSSLVPVLGNGFSTGSFYWSALNMRQVPGYVPANSIYQPGGGNPELIRRASSEDIINVSPFQAFSSSELEIVSLIYDSLLQTNPLTLGTDGQFMDWQTMSHSSVFDPKEVSCNSINGCITGTTTTTWRLRSDLMFQDGTRVTADDVVYSILSYRDVSSATFFNDVSSVSSAIALSSTTVQVKTQGNGFNTVTSLGMIPIIPAHIWEPLCGPIVNGTIPSGPTSTCANYNFDPMAQGVMIGDGPWTCSVPSGYGLPNPGHIGGTCQANWCGHPGPCIGQEQVIGFQILLNRNNGFMRCCPDDTSSSLYKFSWADKLNSGTVGIQDIADLALHWKQPDPYWVNANISPGSVVGISDLAVVALYFQNGITGNIRWQQMTGIDPQIDPFFCPNTGC